MATRIRLRRVGRRKAPEYRIVVAEKTDARDGDFIETIGHYNPRTEPVTLSVDVDKARQWIANGATPSETVHSLLKKAGVFEGSAAAAAPEATASPATPPAEA